MIAPEHHLRAVLQTPFHARTSAANVLNAWHRWQEHTVATAYFDVQLEYTALRNACTVFDLSPMCKHRIEGPEAEAFVERLVTRRVGTLAPGRVGYAVWCDQHGQVIDDGTLFRLEDGSFRLCSQERQMDWLRAAAVGFAVRLSEESQDIAALALQGPTSCAVLKRLGLTAIEQLAPFAHAEWPFDGRRLRVSRTGYTGDLGYELWIEPAAAVALWDALFTAGHESGIRPMGTEALEIARIEAGFLQAGIDFLPADRAVRAGRTRSPFELDLGWLVDFSKPSFNGRQALLAARSRGPRHRLLRLAVDGNRVARDAFICDPRHRPVGAVTSAIWSPMLKTSIALASIRHDAGRTALLAELHFRSELAWQRAFERCRVVDGPFHAPARRRVVPAPFEYTTF